MMTLRGLFNEKAVMGRWILAATIAGAALAVGTVHTVTLCVVAVALAIATALSWWDASEAHTRPRPAATVLLFTGLFLTAYTAVQCIPIPMAWLAAIAPRNADVWARALAPLQEAAPGWAPISLDPGATRVQLLKGVAYLLAFVTALRVAQRREGAAFLGATIIAVGAVLGAAALLHPAFGAHKLFGVFEPSASFTAFDRHLAPFLNPNNLGAYLNVAFCLALAAAFAPEPSIARPVVAAVAVFLLATEVWIASRGAVAAMLIGAVVVVVISRAPRAQQRRALAGATVTVGIGVAAVAIMIVLGGSDQTTSELFSTDVTKLQLVRQALHMVTSYPLFGVGRGAFESAFPAFRQSPGLNTFTHPENVMAQWIIEWGVPVGAAGLGAIAFALRPNVVLARSSTASGAWAGIIAVALQNLVDLGSEVPGLMLAPVVCAAIVVGGTAGRARRSRLEQWGSAPRWLVGAAVAATAVGTVAGGAAVGRELNDDRKALYEAAVGPTTSAAELRWLAKGAMTRHPAEPYLPFIVGWRAARVRDEDPMPWIEGTLERANVYGTAHLVLARMLAKRAPAQARLEYRLATAQAPELAWTIAGEAPRLIGNYDDAMETVAGGKAGIVVLDALAGALPSRLPATCVLLDQELAGRDPTNPGPWTRRARTALEDLSAGAPAPWCDGEHRADCVRAALEASERAEQHDSSVCEPHRLHAQALVDAGETDKALDGLLEAAGVVSDRVACLQAVVELAEQVKDERRTSEGLTKIAAAGCVEDAECTTNLAWVADAERRRGNGRRAFAILKRAHERSPDNDGVLASLAQQAAAAGLHTEAAEDFERLARRHPEDPQWKTAAEGERGAAMRAATGL